MFFFLTVKLMFLPWNWEKVCSKMIVKSTFRCRRTINSPKNCYREKTTLQRMSSRHSPHSSRRWQQQHSTLFLTIGYQIQTFPLKCPYKAQGKRFIVYCWVMDALRRLRIAKLTLTTRGITNSLLTSSACSIGIWRRSRYWIWLGEFSSYVIIPYSLSYPSVC